ncbi:MAG: hypothetical protein HY301_04375 [Verrucomicrobia bacterium]|nr:hypothetical protein [Verrucomicrobiota bacterium]
MSAKETALDVINRLPEDVSLLDIARELEFVAGVREGFASYEREGGVTTKEARARVTAWAKSATK